MSYLISTWEILTKNKTAYRQVTVESLVERAKSEHLARVVNDLNLREIVPSDLGLQSWTTPHLAALSTLNWINCEIGNKVIGIYKIVCLSNDPVVDEITITPGRYEAATTHQLYQLHALIPLLTKIKQVEGLELLQMQYGLENLRMEGWFSEPYFAHPKTKLKIDITSYSPQESNGDTLVLVGFVIEPIKKEETNA